MNQQQASNAIAEAMAQLAHEVMRDFFLAERPDLAEEIGTIRARRGTGKKTYHRKSWDHGKPVTNLIFGAKMVETKLDPQQRTGWLSISEIRERGYYGGDTGLASVLAQTVLHEVSHASQCSQGGRHRGSVHNRFFYQCLDAMHRRAGAYALEKMKGVVEAYVDESAQAPIEAHDDVVTPDKLYKGCDIWFPYQGRMMKGVVRSVNRKTVSVFGYTQSGRVSGRVGFRHVQLRTDDSQPPETPFQERPRNEGSQQPRAVIDGNLISFTIKGRKVTANIVRRNRQTVTAESHDPVKGSVRYRVPYSMIEA